MPHLRHLREVLDFISRLNCQSINEKHPVQDEESPVASRESGIGALVVIIWRHPTSLFAWRGQSAGNVATAELATATETTTTCCVVILVGHVVVVLRAKPEVVKAQGAKQQAAACG